MRILTLLSATGVTICLTTFLTGCGDGGPMEIDEPLALAKVLSQQSPSLALMNAGKPHPFEQVFSGDHWPIGWCDEAAGIPRIWIEGSGTGSTAEPVASSTPWEPGPGSASSDRKGTFNEDLARWGTHPGDPSPIGADPHAGP